MTKETFEKLLEDKNITWNDIVIIHILNPNLRTTFVCAGHYSNQCIPYEGNEHLLGKTDDCNEYFKTW